MALDHLPQRFIACRWHTHSDGMAIKQSVRKKHLDMVIHKIEKEIGAKNVAAIVIEPIQGEGGFIVPPKGFLPGLLILLKKMALFYRR